MDMEEVRGARRSLPPAPVRKSPAARHQAASHLFASVLGCLLVWLSLLSPVHGIFLVELEHLHLLLNGIHGCLVRGGVRPVQKRKETEWKDRSVRTTLTVKLECELALALVSQISSSAGQLLDTQYFFGNNCGICIWGPVFFSGSWQRFAVLRHLYDYTWARDVKMTPPHHPPAPRRLLQFPTCPAANVERVAVPEGVICEKHVDNIDLITTLKGTAELTCDKADSCSTSNYTSGYIITSPPSQQSDTSIKSSSTSEQFAQNKYTRLDKPLWKSFTLWGVTLAATACLSFRGSFRQLPNATVSHPGSD